MYKKGVAILLNITVPPTMDNNVRKQYKSFMSTVIMWLIRLQYVDAPFYDIVKNSILHANWQKSARVFSENKLELTFLGEEI